MFFIHCVLLRFSSNNEAAQRHFGTASGVVVRLLGLAPPQSNDSFKGNGGSPCLSPSAPSDSNLKAVGAEPGRFVFDNVFSGAQDVVLHGDRDSFIQDGEELEFDDNPLPVSNSIAPSSFLLADIEVAMADSLTASTECSHSNGTQQNTPEKNESQPLQIYPAKRSLLLDAPLTLPASSVLPQPIALNPDFESSILEETESNYRLFAAAVTCCVVCVCVVVVVRRCCDVVPFCSECLQGYDS
jgi:hypothetical protein